MGVRTMKKKGEFLATKRLAKQRQYIFDKIIEARRGNQEIYVTVSPFRLKVRPVEMDGHVLVEHSEYLVYHDGAFKIAEYYKDGVWIIDTPRDSELYKISNRYLRKTTLGRVVERYVEKEKEI